MKVGDESALDSPEECIWKLAPDCADVESSDDSTDGKGSGPSSGGGGVRARCKGEALYASWWERLLGKGGREARLTDGGDWGICGESEGRTVSSEIWGAYWG